jgi:hypothetical protein
MLKTQLDRVLFLGCLLLSVAFYGTHLFKILYFPILFGEFPLNWYEWNDVNHNWLATYSHVFSGIFSNYLGSLFASIIVLLTLFITHAICTLVPFFLLRSVIRWIKKGQ